MVLWVVLADINITRACLKNHSRNLHAPLCGIFCPNSVAVARYGAFIRTKFPTNCDAHLAESLFQTRSRFQESFSLCRISNSSPVYLISPYYMHNHEKCAVRRGVFSNIFWRLFAVSCPCSLPEAEKVPEMVQS